VAILAKLYPPAADKFKALILAARAQGLMVAIQCGLRPYSDQAKLYAQGRDSQGNVIGKVVTNARAGFSFHQYGLAVDIVFYTDPLKPEQTWSWDEVHPWQVLADLGVKMGFDSGYYWNGSKQDKPHFELQYGFKISDLLRAFLPAQNLQLVWTMISQRQNLTKNG
jgi:peptidoglycan L-alanyl-D-glutamate endopeptidase CwlK